MGTKIRTNLGAAIWKGGVNMRFCHRVLYLPHNKVGLAALRRIVEATGCIVESSKVCPTTQIWRVYIVYQSQYDKTVNRILKTLGLMETKNEPT